jgi:hypothetical protein
MFNFEFDVDGLIKAAADQMPFALSRALNDAVKDAREHLIDKTWPNHVTVRDSQFIGNNGPSCQHAVSCGPRGACSARHYACPATLRGPAAIPRDRDPGIA